MQINRLALVTGANQGVGFQVAKELVAHGLTVLVGSRISSAARPLPKRSGRAPLRSSST